MFFLITGNTYNANRNKHLQQSPLLSLDSCIKKYIDKLPENNQNIERGQYTIIILMRRDNRNNIYTVFWIFWLMRAAVR